MADEKDEATEPVTKPRASRSKAAADGEAPAKPTRSRAKAAAAEGSDAPAKPARSRAKAAADGEEAPAKPTRSRAKAAAAEGSDAPAKPARSRAKAAAADTDAEAAAPKRSTAKAKAKAADETPAVATEGHGGTLRVHHLRPAPGAKTPKTRVGRGEGSKGKTAGRGTKGTKARYQVARGFEGGQTPLHMRLPKLRGFKNPFRVEYQVVNLDRLGALYPDGGQVTVADLVAKGAVRKGSPVKVLGTGEIAVKLSVEVDALSTSAKEKILAAGGSVANG